MAKIIKSHGACRVLYAGDHATILGPLSASAGIAPATCSSCHQGIDLEPSVLAAVKKRGFTSNVFCNVCAASP
jgi:hypothetical protein